MDTDLKKFAGGEVVFWIEAGSIHLKAISGTDPAELTENDAREIGEALIKLADELEA